MSIIIILVELLITLFVINISRMYYKKTKFLDSLTNIVISRRYYIEEAIEKRWNIIYFILNNMENSLKYMDKKEDIKTVKNELEVVKGWVRSTNRKIYTVDGIIEEQIYMQNQMFYNIINLLKFCKDIKNKNFYNRYLKDFEKKSNEIERLINIYNVNLETFIDCTRLSYFELIDKISENRYTKILESNTTIPGVKTDSGYYIICKR